MSSSLDAKPEDYPEFSTRQPIETQIDGTDFSSSNVHSLLYDFGDQQLIARYKRDGADALYQYDNFPAQEWAGLAQADSKGRYINLNIRDVYGFTRLRLSRWPGGVRSVGHPVARRFLTAPLTSKPQAAHPHV